MKSLLQDNSVNEIDTSNVTLNKTFIFDPTPKEAFSKQSGAGEVYPKFTMGMDCSTHGDSDTRHRLESNLPAPDNFVSADTNVTVRPVKVEKARGESSTYVHADESSLLPLPNLPVPLLYDSGLTPYGIDDMNRQQYGDDLTTAQLAFLRGVEVELTDNERSGLHSIITRHAPTFEVDSLPLEDDELPPLTAIEKVELENAIIKDQLLPAGLNIEQARAKIEEIFSNTSELKTMYRDLKRMQKTYPKIMGQHVHIKPRVSKTRKKKH